MFLRNDIVKQRAKQHGVNEAFLRSEVRSANLFRPTAQELHDALDLILAKAYKSEAGYEAMFQDQSDLEYFELFGVA